MKKTMIRGDAELIRKLKILKWGAARKAIQKANSKAIRPAVSAAKSGVRKESNTVAKGIGVRHKSYPKSSSVVSVVGVRNDASLAIDRPHTNPFSGRESYRKHDPRHTAHLIEGGTKPHQIVIFGRIHVNHPGTAPRPFLEPALTRNESKIIAIHGQILAQELEKAVARVKA